MSINNNKRNSYIIIVVYSKKEQCTRTDTDSDKDIAKIERSLIPQPASQRISHASRQAIKQSTHSKMRLAYGDDVGRMRSVFTLQG